MIHAYTGFENKVREAILADAARLGLEPFVKAVEVPTETVTEICRSKNQSKVTGFLAHRPSTTLHRNSAFFDALHLETSLISSYFAAQHGRARSDANLCAENTKCWERLERPSPPARTKSL